MLLQSAPTRQFLTDVGDPWSRAARIVLALLVVIIAVAPVTQNIWNSDNFLHGRDTETTLTLGLTVASLSILKMERTKAAIEEAWSRLKSYLFSLFDIWIFFLVAWRTLRSMVSVRHNRGKPKPQTGYEIPLLI